MCTAYHTFNDISTAFSGFFGERGPGQSHKIREKYLDGLPVNQKMMAFCGFHREMLAYLGAKIGIYE
jgi:hypothetical protein